MKVLFSAAVPGLCLWCGGLRAEPTAKDAVGLVERGAQFLHLNGKDELINKINTRDAAFNAGTLYLAMQGLDGGTLAHPTTALIGKNLVGVPDADGKPFRREMIAVAQRKGSGWVEYKFMNPVSGKVEPKINYVLRVGDVTLEAGTYRH